MDVLFLAANVLFSAAYRADSGLRRVWTLVDVRLVTSAYVAEEARRNLEPGKQRQQLGALQELVEVVESGFMRDHPVVEQVELAEKDVPVLVAAVELGATHLLTRDGRHFGKLFGHRVGVVPVIRPAEYLRVLG